jgi:hypothetical protein
LALSRALTDMVAQSAELPGNEMPRYRVLRVQVAIRWKIAAAQPYTPRGSATGDTPPPHLLSVSIECATCPGCGRLPVTVLPR